MKYKYETRAVYIDFECEKDLSEIAKEGWRFVSFVPNSSWEDRHEGRKLAVAVFEKEIYKDKMAGGMP